ncbi:AAA family ATPase [Caballeronia sp. LZ035]|uniref:AAA family ATPase n=1 Tax=Caballeronia sp. LZ035 TaxID=3038568 RepID=UPI00285DD097|nr:AAA family ATPase [Caballeronia sp. LZ035]MDR5757525.1 AAA family ATPase [Caballeronia sp. LZ035]
MLIVFAGLPGAGKSTIAAELAKRLRAVYVRIDSIEQAIRDSGGLPNGADIGPAGYVAACRIAADNLRAGLTVIVDSVNPLNLTRDAYREVARQAGATCLDIEVVCSDVALHRCRVETRVATVPGLKLPTWDQVVKRDYEAWDPPPLRLDTAHWTVAQCVEEALAAVYRT